MTKKIEEIISERGFFITKPKGTSMYPMLRLNCTDIVIVPARLPLRKYEIALFKRPDGKYVLHRVWDIRDDGYVFCGDNQCFTESGVTDDMIIGTLDSWHTGDKEHTVRGRGYRLYVRFWCLSLRLRGLILSFCHKFLWRKYRGKSV